MFSLSFVLIIVVVVPLVIGIAAILLGGKR